MPTTAASETITPPTAGSFQPTRWTVVLSARTTASAESERALETLCRTYWYPLYAYVRRCGYDAHHAQDLTQEFFARLLAKNYLQTVDRSKGKFRSFLLACLKHFLANEWDRAHAQKRGGDTPAVPLDGETRYQHEPADDLTPEKLFDRQWALTLLEQVLGRLAAETNPQQFAALKPFLTAGKGAISYANAATTLGTTEGAAKVAVHRLRKRYRELLRAEIAETVADPGQVEEEIRALFAAFGQ